MLVHEVDVAAFVYRLFIITSGVNANQNNDKVFALSILGSLEHKKQSFPDAILLI